MRLYTLLKDTILFIRSVKSLLTDGSTLEDGYIVFPNGMKVCWGTASGLKYGDTVTVPVSYTYGRAIVLPHYNTGTTMRCTFAGNQMFGKQFTVTAYDVVTTAPSTSTTLAISYVTVGY